MFEAEAKERQRASGGSPETKAVMVKLPEPQKGQARDQAARAVPYRSPGGKL